MFDAPINIVKPGLFVAATDTEVGKTVITCAIARALRGGGGEKGAGHVGVMKPFATGCTFVDGELVNDDAVALKHHADSALPLASINPIRFSLPVAPAVAAEAAGQPIDFDSVRQAIDEVQAASDFLLIEGVGGVMAPLDARHTVLDFARVLGLPVVVVARAGLGTLNHTAMTIAMLREQGCRIAGIVINDAAGDTATDDPSVETNRQWIEEMNGIKVLSVVPFCKDPAFDPTRQALPSSILEPILAVDWKSLASA